MIHSTEIRRVLPLILLSLFASASFSQQRLSDDVLKPLQLEFHVLFIGNSFIYFNNMPRMVEAISESVEGPHLKTEMVAIGGARLEDLWKQGSALAAIRKQHWDYVVMNEQSALGGGVVNGEKRIGDPANFYKYAEMFDTEIRKSGGKTVIIMTWKDKNDPDRIQKELDNAFLEFRNANKIILAPVSSAWAITRKTAPEINLYFDDNHHPSKEGSYLEACTTYATLTGRSPVGTTSKVEGTLVEDATGVVLGDKTKTVVNLSARIAAKLQQIAWNTEQEFQIPPGKGATAKLKMRRSSIPPFQPNGQPAHAASPTPQQTTAS
jgi:hypothetical protein